MSLIHEPSPQQVKDEKLYRDMGLLDEEFAVIEKTLGRLPNYTETGLFSVMWSEHCSYKSSKPILEKFPTSGEVVLQGPGEGAGIVDIGDNQAVVFKIESHNSPSAVEPYEGAATGVGGILRDVFSMGARPVALLNSLRFGDLTNDHVKHLFKEAVAGISGYGNRIGAPTIGGEVKFDQCYEKTPLVNAMCVGLLNHEDIQKGQARGVGNTVMYVGAPTGRDGIHGATFSSVELSETEDSRPTVQAGDPFLENRLIEGCLELVKSDALIGIQDMGAAGLTSSAAEMASKADSGLELNMDLVPQREEGMSAYEMMLSESQERMLIVVKKGREQEIVDLFAKFEIEAKAIGTVTDDKQLRLIHHGEVVADVPVDALDEDAPVYYKKSTEPAYYQKFQQRESWIPTIENYENTLISLLKQPTIASKQWVYEQYDHLAMANTVVSPGCNSGVIRIRGTRKALAIATDCNARYIYLDPEVGGQIAVAEAARNVVCSGAQPLAITDGLNYGNPDNPEVFWQMEKSAAGISEACKILNTPVISGNVSLNNETDGVAVYPTPIIGMVGLIKDTDDITTQKFKELGDLIYVIGESNEEFNGSELQKLMTGEIFGKSPELNLQLEKLRQSQVLKAIQAGVVQSAQDISEGGFAVALAKCLFGADNLGANITINDDDVTSALFSETQSRFILSVKKEHKEKFEQLVEAKQIGEVTNDGKLLVRTETNEILINAEVANLETAWRGAIPCLLE